MNNTSVHGVASYIEDDCEDLERNTQVYFDNSRHHHICTNPMPCTFVLRTHYYTNRTRTFNTLPPCHPLHLNDTGFALSDQNSDRDRLVHETTEGLEESISGFALRYWITTKQPRCELMQLKELEEIWRHAGFALNQYNKWNDTNMMSRRITKKHESRRGSKQAKKPSPRKVDSHALNPPHTSQLINISFICYSILTWRTYSTSQGIFNFNYLPINDRSLILEAHAHLTHALGS